MRAVIGRRASRAFLMDWERLHEDLQRAVEELQERSRHAPVIVEGEWDRRSLRALGVVGDIRLVNEGSTIFALCESIAARHREAIILTDWDVRGGRLARQLRDGLAANGVRYDEEIRARLTRRFTDPPHPKHPFLPPGNGRLRRPAGPRVVRIAGGKPRARPASGKVRA